MIQSVGILTGILVGATSIWLAIRNSQVTYRGIRAKALLDITASHRDIWRQYASRPELGHALDWDARPDEMSEDEEQWLRELILHLAASTKQIGSGFYRPRKAWTRMSAS